MKAFILTATGFLILTGSACVAQTEQPSLADLAKSRHSAKKSRVITNDDIATVSPQIESESVNAKRATMPADNSVGGPAAKVGEKKESAQSSSSSSRDTPAVVDLKKKLDNYKEEQESWKRSAKRYEDLLANENDSFRRQMYQDALEGDKRNVALFQDKIDQTQAALNKAQNSR
jgi:hypothetical protein